MKIAMISDEHGHWPKLTIGPCDLLIACGDSEGDLVDYYKWLDGQPARHIVSVLGNHDKMGKDNFDRLKTIVGNVAPRVHLVAEGALEIEGYKIYARSGTPSCFKWARVKPASPETPGAKVYAGAEIIPDETEILVMHAPPKGTLDVSCTPAFGTPVHQGQSDVAERIAQLKDLRLCVFGHVHPSSGECDIGGVRYVNASLCDIGLNPINPVRTYELPDKPAPAPAQRLTPTLQPHKMGM